MLLERNYKYLSLGLAISFLLTIVSMKTLGSESRHMLFFLEHDFLKFPIFALIMLSFAVFVLQHRNLFLEKRDQAALLLFALALILVIYSPSHGFSDILRLFVFLPFFFIKPIEAEQDLAAKFLKKTLWVVPLVMLCYSVYNNVFWPGSKRLVFSSTDPNFSAMYALLGMLLADKLSMKKTFLAFLILGVATFSRNFLLGLMVFFFVRLTQRVDIFKFLYDRIKPIYVYILAQVVVLILGALFLSRANFSSDNALLDNSNELRFLYSSRGLEYLTTNKDAILYGAGSNYWAVEKGGTGAAETYGAVHNSLLNFMIEDGIVYALLTLLLVFVIVNKRRDQGYEYIYAFLISTLFLHDIFTWSFLFMWCFVLSVNKYPTKKETIEE